MSSHDCSRPMRGWVRGSLTATAAIELCFLIGLLATAHGISAGGAIVVMVWMFAFAPLVWLVACALSALPALLVVRLSERFRIRSVLFFGCAGAVIGALSPVLLLRSLTKLDFGSITSLDWVFAVSGCLAGLTYWYVAGRYAGQDDLAAVV
jgi:hypothetical protein